MARYFLHLHNGIGFLADTEGLLADSVEEARAAAIANIRSVLADEVRAGQLNLRGRIDVADERGTVISTVRFDEAVEVVDRDDPA